MKRSSLAEERPDLLESWSPHNEISPYDITCGSHKKVLWRCKKNHEWAATVKNRALIGSGCPYCGCRAVLKGFNDLATIHPELISEWSEKNHPLNPTDVSAYSNRKVWWCCSKGHEWYALISSRSDGHGCPYCAGQLVLEGYNDLKTTHPDIAHEWSERNVQVLPTTVTAKSRLNVWWHCNKCGKDYKAVIDSRVKGLICPYCVSDELERIRQERKIAKAIDKDFKYYLPQLAVVYYAGKKGLRVILDDSD
ncbi:MAG: zinc-ribbon domain-containing protein, partial [Clostridiales bacterium]|nr:zinc-ribbon domain-containing protein [Clostridiales bacterium]